MIRLSFLIPLLIMAGCQPYNPYYYEQFYGVQRPIHQEIFYVETAPQVQFVEVPVPVPVAVPVPAALPQVTPVYAPPVQHWEPPQQPVINVYRNEPEQVYPRYETAPAPVQVSQPPASVATGLMIQNPNGTWRMQ